MALHSSFSSISPAQQSEIDRDAAYINQQHKQGINSFVKGLEYFRNAGERLSKVRNEVKTKSGRNTKGLGFKEWIEKNCIFSRTTAYEYITVFDNWVNVSAQADTLNITGLKDALRYIKEQSTEKRLKDAENTVDVDFEVVKEDTPETKKKLTKAEKELAKLKQQLEESKETIKTLKSDNKELQKLPPQQVTVIDQTAENKANKLEEDNVCLREEIQQLKDTVEGLQIDLSTQRPPKPQDDSPYQEMYHNLELEKDEEIEQLRVEYEI